MAFVKSKTLYTVTSAGSYEALNTVLGEVFLTADRNGMFSFAEYRTAILSPISTRVTRMFILNEDETIRDDISEFLVNGTITMSQASGVRKTGTITLWNENKMFSPNVINNLIWEGSKLRIDTGIYYNGYVFWQRQGVFVVHNPSDETEDNTVSFSVYDKFALLDGTVSGKRDSEFKITVGTSVRDAIALCLKPDENDAYDTKTVIFPTKYISQKTPYTIDKEPNCTMGEIIIDLAKMISCDVYYNEMGNLVVFSDSDDINYDTAPIQWIYTDKDGLTSYPTLACEFSKIANKVTVTGAIENGKQYRGVYENTNPVTKHYTKNTYYLNDSNIIGDDLCLDRAKYEYKKNCRLNIQLKFVSVYLPHLLPDSVVLWSNAELGYRNEKFIINSLDVDLMNSTTANMSLTYLEGLKI